MMYDGLDYNRATAPSQSNSSSGAKLQRYQRVEAWEENIAAMNHGTPEEEASWMKFLQKMKDDRKSNLSIQWKRKEKNIDKS